MRFPRALNSRHLFLYAGFGLIFLALVSLAIKIQVNVQSPEFPDYEDFNIGLLFAPVIGSYGLASLVLGITESSLLRKEILPCLLPVFALLYIGLGFASWMVMNYGVLWFWRTYFGFILLPFLITHTAVLFYFTKKERLAQILSNIQTRTYAFIALVSVPLFYAVIFFFLFSIFT